MPDVFISYSSHDEGFAQFLYRHLVAEELSVFLASVSLSPGTRWSPAILENLRSSNWVFFLASRAACNSPNVQMEMGAAVITRKKLIPIVWDMSPSDLPGWTKEFQALDLVGASAEQVRDRLSAIAGTIKNEKSSAGLLAVLLIAGLIYAATRK